MRRLIRLFILGAVVASSIGISTLIGCRSNDTAPLGSGPTTGRVAKVTMELHWPPGAAAKPENAGPIPIAAPAPAKYPPIVSTQPPLAPVSSPAPATPGVPPQAVASAQTSAASVPEPSPAPKQTSTATSLSQAVASKQAVAAAGPDVVPAPKPEYLPEMLQDGKAVPELEPQKTAMPAVVAAATPVPALGLESLDEVQVAAAAEQNSGAVVQASLKQPVEPSTKEIMTVEHSVSAKQAVAVEPPSMSQFVDNAPAPAVARDERAPAAEPAFHVVNSKRVKLHFEVKDAGPAGIAAVEVWYIHENREWKRADALLEKKGPVVLEVEGEGLYGFRLVARNSQGRGEPLPQAGDAPQVWVLVDLTKPVVKINSAKVTREADGAKLEMSWRVSDKNLGRRPVTLFYAEQPEGPWRAMAANLESAGIWQKRLPASMPRRFLVRVEAMDMAGNVGAEQTREFLELEQPPSRVSILKID